MNDLFLFFFLVSLCCLVVGLLNPLLFQKFFKDKVSRKKLSLYFGSSTILFFILFGVTSSPVQKNNKNVVPVKQINQEITQQQKNNIQKTQEITTTSSAQKNNENVSPTKQIKPENIQQQKGDMQKIQESAITIMTGAYDKYAYNIMEKKNEKTKVITFQPFLPRNDDIFLWAVHKITTHIFGSDVLKGVTPTLEKLANEKNVILFNALSGKYYYLPNKEDTGEINGITFWKE